MTSVLQLAVSIVRFELHCSVEHGSLACQWFRLLNTTVVEASRCFEIVEILVIVGHTWATLKQSLFEFMLSLHCDL